MSKAKIAITMEEEVLLAVDRLVDDQLFKNRSRLIEDAVRDKLAALERGELTRECAKLDPQFERFMAEEGMAAEATP